ncbi:MAG: hypothetical protein H0X26_04385 [Alphaproteobacteria bacterium]|nr:hypothetical protein [Alphaproteobacteria bacterium]
MVKLYSIKAMNFASVIALSSLFIGTVLVESSFAMHASESEKYSGQNLFSKKQRQSIQIKGLKPETGKQKWVLKERNQFKHQKNDLRREDINNTTTVNDNTNKENIENFYRIVSDKFHDNDFFNYKDITKSLECLSLDEFLYKRKVLDTHNDENIPELNTKKPKYTHQPTYDPLTDEPLITEFPLDLKTPMAIYNMENDIYPLENNHFVASPGNINDPYPEDRNSVVVLENWKNRDEQIAPSMVPSIGLQQQCYDEQVLQWQLSQNQHYQVQHSYPNAVSEGQLRNAPQWYQQQIELYYTQQFYQHQNQPYYAPQFYQQPNQTYYAPQFYQQSHQSYYYDRRFYQQQEPYWYFQPRSQLQQQQVFKETKPKQQFYVLPLLFPELQGNPKFQTDRKLQEKFMQKLEQRSKKSRRKTW